MVTMHTEDRDGDVEITVQVVHPWKSDKISSEDNVFVCMFTCVFLFFILISVHLNKIHIKVVFHTEQTFSVHQIFNENVDINVGQFT